MAAQKQGRALADLHTKVSSARPPYGTQFFRLHFGGPLPTKTGPHPPTGNPGSVPA